MDHSLLGSAAVRVLALLGWVAAAGCATSGEPPQLYELPARRFLDAQIEFPGEEPQIELGRPIPFLDGLNDYVLSAPIKLVLWNRRLLDHRLEQEDRAVLERYLALNGMTAVKVRHNQYAPLEELRRLTQNTEVGAGYRYTLGVFQLLVYTLLPDRLLAGVPVIGAGDHFNPFTNTIHVYSSDPAVLLHEAGHAKDYLQHDRKGTSFILVRLIPGVALLQEARASTDAIRFLYCVGDAPRERRAYRSLFPAFATYVAGYAGGGLAVVPAVLGGHFAGSAKERARSEMAQSPEDRQRRALQPPFCVGPEPAPSEPAPAD